MRWYGWESMWPVSYTHLDVYKRQLLDEGDPAKVKALDEAFCNKCVTNEILFETGRGIAPWMASLTFGGRDRRTVYIGSLRATRIPYFESPVPGLPMVHWK